MFEAFHVHAHGDVRRPVLDLVPVTDLDDDRVQIQDRIQRIERALLPFEDFVQDVVGDLGNRSWDSSVPSVDSR
jgi:hypothetical protein